MNRFALLTALLVLSSGCLNQNVQENAGAGGTNPKQGGGGGNAGVKTFALTGMNFKFLMDGAENPVIRVNQGDRVRVDFTSTQGFHDWVVDEFNAATQRVWAVNSTSVEFVADKKGTFEYYCSVGQHRQMGMKGNLTVE